MSEKVVCIASDTPLVEIVNLVVEREIHTFPVTNKGKLVGIIGRHDILNAAFCYA